MGGRPPASTSLTYRLRRRLKAVRRWIAWHFGLRPLLWFVTHAPARLMRWLLHSVVEPIAWRATRKASDRHLRKVYGDQLDASRRRALTRAVTRNFVAGLEETTTMLREGPDWLTDRVDDAETVALVRRLEQESPRGFLGLTGHVGNWEALGAWISRTSARGLGAVVAHRMTNPHLNAAVDRIRRRLGMLTFYRDDPPTQPIRHLRDGRVVAVVPDQDVKNLGGIFIPFLGHQAYTPTGPARLALAARVPIVPGVMVRTEPGRFRIEIGEPIHPDFSNERNAEIERLTRAWSAWIEQVIRRHPEQWAWWHPRWATTPEKLTARGRKEA